MYTEHLVKITLSFTKNKLAVTWRTR